MFAPDGRPDINRLIRKIRKFAAAAETRSPHYDAAVCDMLTRELPAHKRVWQRRGYGARGRGASTRSERAAWF